MYIVCLIHISTAIVIAAMNISFWFYTETRMFVLLIGNEFFINIILVFVVIAIVNAILILLLHNCRIWCTTHLTTSIICCILKCALVTDPIAVVVFISFLVFHVVGATFWM